MDKINTECKEMQLLYKKDYLCGTKLFKKLNFTWLHATHIPIWLPCFNKILAENNACYEFYTELERQNLPYTKIGWWTDGRFIKAKHPHEIFHGSHAAFDWSHSKSGFQYWQSIDTKLHDNIELGRLLNIPLEWIN